MPRLVVDPNTAQCPDYSLDIYHAVRLPFVTLNSDHEQAAVILTTVWGAQNTVERQQWQDQLDLDAAEAAERRLERERQEEINNEKDKQQKEDRKKNRAEFAPIPPRRVPTTPPIIISAIPSQCMDKGDYVPL